MSDYSSEIKDFESEYYPGEREIIILRSSNNGGAGRAGGKKLWTASALFLAYIDAATGELKSGEGRVVWPMTEEEYSNNRKSMFKLKPEHIYRLRVRELIDKTVPEGRLSSFYNRFMLVEVLEENAENKVLSELLAEYKRPVILNDEQLGSFTLNKDLKFFEGKISWNDKSILAYFDVALDDEATWQQGLEGLRELVDNREELDATLRAFAAQKLTSLANDWREDESDKEITEQDFAERISINSISIGRDGRYCMYYNDDDMFYGHVITVYGGFSTGPEGANMEG